MSLAIYPWLLAAICGFVGGMLAKWLTAMVVDDLWRQADQVSPNHVWVFSTGGRSTATLRDVWRYKGGGPEEIAAYLPGTNVVLALIALGVLTAVPPPVLATGYPVPAFTWLSVGGPLTVFLVTAGIGFALAIATQDEPLLVPVALLPAAVLLITWIISYFVSLSYWLVLGPFAAAILVTAVGVALLSAKAYGDARIGGWATLGLAVVTYLPMGVLLTNPPYSPIHDLLKASVPSEGLPGSQGEPPLKIKEIVPPVSIARAGWFERKSPYRGHDLYVELKDSTEARYLLCVGDESDDDGTSLDQANSRLYVGGTHSSHASARLPLSRDEANMLYSALQQVAQSTPGVYLAENAFDFRTRQLDTPAEERTDEHVAFIRLAGEALRRLPSPDKLPLASHSDLAERFLAIHQSTLEELAREFRETPPGSRVAQWENLTTKLMVDLKSTPVDRVRERLVALLGEPASDGPQEFEGSHDYAWEYPPPMPFETLAYKIEESESVARFGMIDLRGSMAPLRTVTIHGPRNTSNDRFTAFAEAFRKAPVPDRLRAWHELSRPLTKWAAQSAAPYSRSKLPEILGPPEGEIPSALSELALRQGQSGEVMAYLVGEYEDVRQFLLITFNSAQRARFQFVEVGRDGIAEPKEVYGSDSPGAMASSLEPADTPAEPGPSPGPDFAGPEPTPAEPQLIGSPSPPTQPGSSFEMRQWQSSDGQFRTEAALIAGNLDVVMLRKASGKTIRVPINKLSSEDQQWLRLREPLPPLDAGEPLGE